MNTIQIEKPAKTISDIQFKWVDRPQPNIPKGECLIEVHAAAINPSDVKGALGTFQHAVWPRVPGRDYAGVVMNGPAEWFGKAVWGSGGDLGITRDGSFSRYLLVSTDALSEKPESLSMLQAASVGVPFVTAYHAVIDLAQLSKGEVLVVFGANGQVGSAAMQIGKLVGAKVIGVTRQSMSSPHGHIVNSKETAALDGILQHTHSKGADVVLNCVGKPYFKEAQMCLGVGGRQVLLSTLAPEDDVSFNVLEFYRKGQQLVGANTMHVDHITSAKILNVLHTAFEEGSLVSSKIDPSTVFSLKDAEQAFSTVMEGNAGKCVFDLTGLP